MQIGKSGTIYILDRDNNTDGSNNPATEYSPAGLGGFNAASDQVVQEVQTPKQTGIQTGDAGVWGTEAYWNNNIYSGGTNTSSATYADGQQSHRLFLLNGVLSTTPTSQTVEQFHFPGPTPSVSANGTTNGIVWALKTDAILTGRLRNSTGLRCDQPWPIRSIRATPTWRGTIPGRGKIHCPDDSQRKVYVGASGELSVYGLLASTPTAPAPVISPSVGDIHRVADGHHH